jgi:hypothetical protein
MIERLLVTIAVAHVAAGLALTLLPLAPAVHFALASAIFGADKSSPTVMFLISVFGPTIASWGVLFFALVKTFFRHPAKGSWRALVLSIVLWAPLDSVLSMQYGLHAAVILNAGVAVVVLGLLFSERRLAYQRQS